LNYEKLRQGVSFAIAKDTLGRKLQQWARRFVQEAMELVGAAGAEREHFVEFFVTQIAMMARASHDIGLVDVGLVLACNEALAAVASVGCAHLDSPLLFEINLDGKDLRYVLLSHSHGDHSGATYLWRTQGARIVAPATAAFTVTWLMPTLLFEINLDGKDLRYVLLSHSHTGTTRNAFTNLAASVNALAGVLDVATSRLRQSLALDEVAPALTHGEVIDNDEPAPAKRNGKAKATA
jgi:glyoxylase-like metal-dependent hydrolase (beta-lactamase superfamily II)